MGDAAKRERYSGSEDADGKILREVHDGACGVFDAALDPNTM